MGDSGRGRGAVGGVAGGVGGVGGVVVAGSGKAVTSTTVGLLFLITPTFHTSFIARAYLILLQSFGCLVIAAELIG